MPDPNLYAVVMAGGSGTRFWPASRSARPKQYMPIAGGRPMLAETLARLEGLVPNERRLVVTSASQVELVREVAPELAPENIIAEPMARNTAPCVALAAYEVARRDPDAVQVVLAADHVIEPAESFRETLRAASVAAAREDVLITLGVKPDFAATGYGYIECGDALEPARGIAVHEVTRFVEKPDLATAQSYVQSGRHFWNAGIFVWSNRAIDAALAEHLPAARDGLARLDEGASLAEVYAELPAEPIDVAVMEQADNVRMLPIDYEWNDVGSWAALADMVSADADSNLPLLSDGARLISVGAERCLAYAEGEHVVALVGVEDLVVVSSGNATLVCPRDRAQDVKKIVEELKAAEGGDSFL